MIINNLIDFINNPKVLMAITIINKYYNIMFDEEYFFICQKDWDNGMEFDYSDNLANTLIYLSKLLKNKRFYESKIFYNNLFKHYINENK